MTARMTNNLPSWKGWLAVFLTILAGIVLPNLIPMGPGHAGKPLPLAFFVAAVFFFFICSISICLAWRRGRFSDRVFAAIALALMFFGIVVFVYVIYVVT
jgi:Mn2+/Fe2+ NRAMP family transporter